MFYINAGYTMETEDRFVCLRTNVESANITEEKYEGKIRTQKYDSCVFQQDLTQCVCVCVW